MTPKLERYTFVPLKPETAVSGKGDMSRVAAITTLLHLAAENSGGASKLKAVELEGQRGQGALLAPLAVAIIGREQHYILDIAVSSTQPLPECLTELGIKQTNNDLPARTDIILTTDSLADTTPATRKKILDSLKPGGFVLTEEVGSNRLSVPKDLDLVVVAKQQVDKYSYLLLRKLEKVKSYHTIKVNNNEFSWVEPLKKVLKDNIGWGERILLVAQGEEFSGLAGLILSLMKEPGGQSVRAVLILDPKAPAFSCSDPVYAKQLQLDLVSNVLRDASKNEWGTYRHTLLDIDGDAASRQVEHAYIDTLSRGYLSAPRWFEAPSYHR